MDILLNIFRVTLEEGLMYALLAMGVYITYSILDFPDLSVDGTMPMGAVVTAVLIIAGVNPWLCLLISFVLGMLAGTVTGLLHVKLNIRPLLCGIIVYTAMLSVNLVILFISIVNICKVFLCYYLTIIIKFRCKFLFVVLLISETKEVKEGTLSIE